MHRVVLGQQTLGWVEDATQCKHRAVARLTSVDVAQFGV